MQPFDPEAKTRKELMDSRSARFIALDARAAKGYLATSPLTREERALVEQFSDLTRELARREIDEPVETDRAW